MGPTATITTSLENVYSNRQTRGIRANNTILCRVCTGQLIESWRYEWQLGHNRNHGHHCQQHRSFLLLFSLMTPSGWWGPRLSNVDVCFSCKRDFTSSFGFQTGRNVDIRYTQHSFAAKRYHVFGCTCFRKRYKPQRRCMALGFPTACPLPDSYHHETRMTYRS